MALVEVEGRVGYNPEKPVEELSPVEALAMVNRWAKLKGYFYYDDLDRLYVLKDRKIAEFTTSGLMVPTYIIRRESPAIERMRQQIATHGMDLNHLNWLGYEWYDQLNSVEPEGHYQTLNDLANGNMEIPLPPDEVEVLLANWEQEKQQYEMQMQEYQQQLPEYQQQLQTYQALKAEYDRQLEGYQQAVYQAFRKHLEEKDLKGEDKSVLTLLQRNATFSNKQQKRINKAINKHQFRYQGELKQPQGIQKPKKLKQPQYPQKPDLTRRVNGDDYVIGTYAHVDAAIEWAKTTLNQPDLTPNQIDDSFICDEVESYLGGLLLAQLREQALAVFQQVIGGSLTNPKAIYDALTALSLNYSEAIRMEPYEDYRNHRTVHKDFGKWHEINFSPTGHCLIEFQATEYPEITLHVPYDRRRQLSIQVSWDELPTKGSDQGKFGREVSIQEQSEFPLEALLAILGTSPDDFPYGLRNYHQARHGYRAYQCWDDEDDWITEFDEEEWSEVGY